MSLTTIDLHAYAIPILHAAKYPAFDICGALLGKRGTKDQQQVEIITAVPFFHQWTTMTPMLEVGLKQTALYAEKQGLSIVGWYHGNARLNDPNIPERAKKVAETIRKNNEGTAYIFMIDNEEFSKENPDKSIIIPYTFADNGWRKLTNDQMTVKDADTFTKTRDLIDRSVYTDIHDFDEHLNDVSLNWLSVSQMSL